MKKARRPAQHVNQALPFMIKEINGRFYIVNLEAFHGFPFPTRADAEEALIALTKEPHKCVMRPTNQKEPDQ